MQYWRRLAKTKRQPLGEVSTLPYDEATERPSALLNDNVKGDYEVKKSVTVACSAPAAVLVMLASGAYAQDPTPQPASTASVGALEEVIVTAQKREQSITDVGMSIAAISGDALQDMGVTSAADLSKVVPGLNVSPPGANISGAPVYTLRGVGFNEKSLAALSAVSFYSDEVPLPYVYMTAGPSLDLQRVEVLKGPQGTLYGQNSTGGAINFIANKPTETFEAGVAGSYSRFNRFDGSGYLSGPLTDTLQARIAFRGIEADGWQRSKSRPGDELGSTSSYATRVLLDWQPAEALKFAVNLNGWKDRSQAPGAQLVGFNPAVYDPAPFLVSPAFYPNYDALITNAIVQPDDARVTDWTPGIDYKNDNEFGQAALRADWNLTENLTLTSITAQSYFRYRTFHDIDASTALLNHYTARGDIHAFSQELRLAGKALDRLNWIVGGNYSDDSIFDSSTAFFDGSTLGIFAQAPLVTTAGVSIANSERTSKAAFASADFDLTPSVTLTGGVRYTEIDLDFNGCAADNGNGTISSLVTGTTAFAGQCVTVLSFAPFRVGLVRSKLPEHNVSWRGGVNWKPLDETLLYANVSRGYKSGNIPNVTGTLASQFAPVKQEEVTAYEIGFKTELADGALRLNGAVFHMDYNDKQLYGFIFLPVVQSASEQTVNIPKSKVDGAELEAVWNPLEGLVLRAGGAYTKSEIETSPSGVFFGNTSAVWPPPAGFVTLSPGDLKGLPFNLAPKWQGNVDGVYEWSVMARLTAFAGATVVYSDSTLPTIGASQESTMPSYTTVDLRAGVGSSDERWRATLWGRNVTDEVYVTGVARGFDVTSRFLAMPATYGVTFEYSFE